LRGLDLNQRPLGYERLKLPVSRRKQGTSGNPEPPWERLETPIGDLMGTEIALRNDLPNDLPNDQVLRSMKFAFDQWIWA
jgi:hypothetical protein